MKLIDRYISQEITIRFVFLFFLTTALLSLEEVYHHFYTLLQAHVSFTSGINYYLAHSVVLLPLTIPIAFLLSLLSLFCFMHRHNELTALSASGISFLRLIKTLWPIAIVLSLILLVANLWIIPESQTYTQNYLKRITSKSNINSFYQGKNYLFYAGSLDHQTARDIIICTYDPETKQEIQRLRADSAYFQNDSWVFIDGQITYFNEKHTAESVKNFDNLADKTYNISPQMILLQSESPEKLTFFQLTKLANDSQSNNSGRINLYKFRICNLLLKSFIPILLLWSCVPFVRRFRPRISLAIILTQLVFYLFLISFATHLWSSIALRLSVHWLYACILPWIIAFLLPLVLLRFSRHS